MLISPAFAQTAGAASPADMFSQFMPLLLIFVVFYFLLIRPQQKKAKMHKEMLNALRRGDRVVTGGGIIGTITKVKSDTEVQVEIADGVKVLVARDSISVVMAKTEAADKVSANDSDDDSQDDQDGNAKTDGKSKSTGLKKLLGG
ncbi:preprotein translocase subunit YajC [Magnetovibrio blakemorei]|uniref:Sec translocon accessory complex subunit YajC n=1 Tax=Magnetovibrio blakemorei TaxID=28181 RepID=A0A1E5QAA4_9PROT|nr:preprotein translocase subunit YajC [Magnetovibrio blakemorei]OEJ68880.1 preprotein translocase subunit YajC [Magnetovibrio blakemorei]